MAEMTVSFDRTPEQWISTYITYLEKTEPGRLTWRRGRLVYGLVVAAFTTVMAGSVIYFSGPTPAALIFVACLMMIGIPVAVRLFSYMLADDILRGIRRGDYDDFFERQEVTLKEDGFRVRVSLGEQTVYWKSVKDVVTINGEIFLLLVQGGFMEIPERAFSSSQHQTEFLEQVARFRRGEATPKQAWYQSRDQVGDDNELP